MPRTKGALGKKTLAKGGPKPTPPVKPAPVVKTETPADPKKPVSSTTQPTSGLKGLAERILAERGGDPKKAKTATAATAVTTSTDKKTTKKQEMEDLDPNVADSLAGVLGEGEASIASAFVPDDKADHVEKVGGRMLKYAWKYHFIQHGVNGFPSWAVILLAHLGLLALTLKPNLDRIGRWFDEVTGKIKKTTQAHDPAKAAQSLHIAKNDEQHKVKELTEEEKAVEAARAALLPPPATETGV